MENEFKGVRAFLMIPPSISRDEDLLKNPKSILLMGEIISMLNVTGEFFMSNRKIAEHLRVSIRQVNRYLDLLEKKKLIEREKVVSDKNGAVLGRKIHAGSALMTHMSLGWGTECHEGNDIDDMPLVSPASHKYSSINRSSNRTVNKSSSVKKEEDPEREKIYKEFFTIARMNDKLKNHSTNPTLDELKQLRGLLYQCNIDTLQAVKDKFKERMTWDMVGKPYSYLLKMLRDGLANDRNYESWG
ncbi:helix-turn-helix domain-containing protein [Lactobacillus crispatus]|uniref:helix-turn-helix domain-containing protein n=1 Tax=Lactobacillus crispatus TaxID=47770 RepID=UPI0022AC3D6D|nr:helix-turn-helix domain-containing protein [Lactobacillus crispatus]MCT7753279.1 helix-turn-helix domain-containing protein [Lactobacillus crispatus]MCT7763023.1 helix-turn-helix domain-containing protein [Lactobacillus crispatus]MCZ3690936.1 helix-turn-helix domain-containing protein [Lactobacillus crispatus]MCZ3693222.1 helix-turn-helix domain-containing protein [Lactobacillus crispatus]MCZ3696947.1 helix-turn-helix domain-containing protein [Lactobacillus crispatus]